MKRTLLASSIAALIILPAAVYAADEPADGEKIDRVVVTGSNISRINREGPTAVEIIKRSDIEKTGATTVVELLGKIPSVTVELTGNSKSSFAMGATSVGLRGLPAKYTLILLNGRRVANYGFAVNAEDSFVDLSSIPLSAIESIEILRDGASAIYGSDAVAGVINFKTRKNFQGLEVAANLGVNEKGDGATKNVNITGGWGDLNKDGQNFLLTFNALQSNPLWSDKHAATKNSDMRRFGGTDQRSISEGLGGVADYTNGDPGYAIPGCRGSVEVADTGDTRCYTQSKTSLSPKNERFGLSGVFTQRLNSTDELFAELAFNHSESRIQGAFPAFDTAFLGSTVGSKNPALANLPGPSDVNYGFELGDQLRIFRSIYEADPTFRTTTSNTVRIVSGWRGLVGQWDSEFGASFNQNQQALETSGMVLKTLGSKALQQGISGNGGYDPFVYKNPESSFSSFLTTTNRTAQSRLLSLDWKMSTDNLFSLNGNPFGFAWGAQASRETINDQPDSLNVIGAIANYGATESKGGRSLYSLYGELSGNILKNLEMQFALRDDYYSDFGNAFNPKLAFAWRPIQEVLVRASATTSFKAPTLPEVGSTTTAFSTVADWARCKPLGYVGPQCAYSPRIYLQGNPDLKAEKANNYSFGFVFQPIKNLSASLDWYLINQKNTIQAEDPQYILDHESNPVFAALIGRDPRNPGLEARNPGLDKGRINSITSPYINVGKTDIQGLDLDLKYVISFGSYGQLNFREVNNYTLTFKQSIAPDESPESRLDGTNHPKWRNTFRTGYQYQNSELALTARTQSSTKNITDPTYEQDPEITAARIPSYTVWDLNFNTKLNEHATLNFGINNVFDKSPVYSSSTYKDDFVPSLNDYIGRYYYANINYKF